MVVLKLGDRIMKKYPQRKSPRLQGYDYSQSGAYFVTICTHERQHLFGTIEDHSMILNDYGKIASERWYAIPGHYPDVELDAFVVMPNHVHGILCLLGDDKGFKTILGRVINAYKGAVTAQIRKQHNSNVIVWQGRYHDHIIRNEKRLNRIRQYVIANPQLWQEDTFYIPSD
jgi:REP element-mobilizing transposase RayT